MTLGITDLTTFIIGTIAVILLPGPNSMFVLTTAAQKGVRDGYRAALGVFVGDSILMLLAALGAATVFKTAPAIFVMLKLVGGVYLGFLGLKMLIGAYQIWQNRSQRLSSSELEQNSTVDAHEGRLPQVEQMGQSPFVKALLISLINPKAILFCVSFFVQFVSPDAQHPLLAFLVLAAILQACSMLYLSLLIVSGDRLAAVFRARPMWMVAGTAAVGVLFLGFGLRLATATME